MVTKRYAQVDIRDDDTLTIDIVTWKDSGADQVQYGSRSTCPGLWASVKSIDDLLQEVMRRHLAPINAIAGSFKAYYRGHAYLRIIGEVVPYREAEDRVKREPELAAHAGTILCDWPEGDDHWRWVASADVDEIVDWALAIEQG